MPLEHVLHLLHRPPYSLSMHSCISFLRMHDSIMEALHIEVNCPAKARCFFNALACSLVASGYIPQGDRVPA